MKKYLNQKNISICAITLTLLLTAYQLGKIKAYREQEIAVHKSNQKIFLKYNELRDESSDNLSRVSTYNIALAALEELNVEYQKNKPFLYDPVTKLLGLDKPIPIQSSQEAYQ